MAGRLGVLVCVGGSPGSGKTTVGTLVAQAGEMTLVDLDSVTTALVEAFAAGLGVVADLDAPRFAALRDARYACLAAVAADNLRAGRDVVAVAPFTSEAADAVAWRERGKDWGAGEVVLCWLDVDADVTARRVAERALPRDLAKAERAPATRGPGAAGAATASGPTVRPTIDRAGLDIVADGTRPPQETCARVLAAARARERGGRAAPLT
ncbi:MAG TPA: AAA family ATPase [Ornithinibacter sp.]|nr:AAA family ATPase [Ornithinibacter sp.]